MHQKEVNICFPRFKLDEKLDLNDGLARMGIVDLFLRDRADQSGVDDSKMLYVSNILHKAFIEVNEEGSEAGATNMKSYMLSYHENAYVYA
jgi:serpin B